MACVRFDKFDEIPWWILATEYKVARDRQMVTIVGTFKVEGTLELQGAARLAVI
jgi:hypothetical protein